MTLRLAIVRQRYNPFGGAERFVARALPALERAGAAVTLIARRAEVRWIHPQESSRTCIAPFARDQRDLCAQPFE
jgi:UDP-glucose:(heptosyl)LPS alpha-1,3-glucosyltransferase